ncbi:MAG: hypothetical protein K8F60_03080 [Melioribacteraceae bacterium]|nr:hypothetical protein [Melioribacteraceae bacterium]
MNNSKLTELTNKFIDNELNEREKLQLDELLKIEENKKYFTSLTETVGQFNKSKPPFNEINLEEKIMQKINNESNSSFGLKDIFSELFKGNKLGYAFSFAMGLIIAVSLFLLQKESLSLDEQFIQGTAADRSFDEAYFLDETSFNGSVKVKYSEGLVILDVDLNTLEQLDCELKFNKNEFSFFGVKSIKSESDSKFSTSNSSVRLTNLKGNRYLVFLKNLKDYPSKVHASFYSGNYTVANLTIDIKK